MSEFFGEGTTRTLSARARQFVNVVWQKGKPPLDSELNLIAQINEDAQQSIVSSSMSSGWLGNVVDPMSDYDFNKQASNMCWLGKDSSTDGDVIWANVNGWLIPVVGTNSSDNRNAILLPPPKADVSESDVNFVFLEVWKAQISPDGSVNKPGSNLLYKYGNVEYGGTNLNNDLLDPTILFETTERVQLQYRLRVVGDVNPAERPHGFGPLIKAQGTLDNPTTNTNPVYQFSNMEQELGDPGLWRAGTGNSETDLLNTVDGHVYAIPLCFVFRRTTNNWSITQQHGATDRNPNMADRSEASILSTVSLTTAVGNDDMTLEVDTTQGSTTFSSGGGLVRLGNEILEYSSYTGTTITITTRGAKRSHATSHEEGATLDFVTGHPTGLFSDQIVSNDLLDLRHIISPDGLDYDGLLRQNFGKLVKGKLSSSWKKSNGSVKGREYFQVDYFGPDSNAPDYTIGGDRPDGLRKIFSDACTLQPNNLVILGSAASVSSTADLQINPNVSILREDADAWNIHDTILLDLDQYRGSIPLAAPNNRKVRFVHPFEYDASDHDPVRVWFGDTDPTSGDAHKQGALALDSDNSDPWFMVLGAEMEGLSTVSSGQGALEFNGISGVIDVGVTFTAQDGDLLSEADAWVLITPGSDSASTDPDNRGAYKIVGVSGGNLEVVTAAGDTPTTFGGTTNRAWSIRLPQCTENDTDMALVLVRDPVSGTFASNTTLHFAYDLLYHPARGISRVPDQAIHVELDAGVGSNFVREDSFRNVATSANPSVKKSPAISMSAYPHHHNTKFQIRNSQDVASGTESVWAEAYVDRGSKTLLYQPLRNVSVRLDPQDNPTAISYTDATDLFNITPDDSDASVLIPKELRPSLGRLDLPFVTSKASVSSTSTSPAYGINCLLHSGSDDLNTSQLVEPRIQFIYAPNATDPSDFGTWDTILNITGAGPAQEALVCRLYDRGGVRGIELPPHYGIARLFAAHFLADYNGSSIFSGPDAGYRSPSGTERLNLLREDADRRSLIITDENTFVIPEDALDPSYIGLIEQDDQIGPVGSDLENQSLVFEIATFLFDDWTSDFMRVHRRAITTTPMSSDFRMYVNGPSESGDEFFLVSSRIPYQGSIYGTMPVSAADTNAIEYTDYRPKRQTERPQSILDLFTALDESTARIENPATLEILSSFPFATTLGTGALSGKVVPGSYTDVGYLSLAGYPFSDITDPEREALTKAHPCTASGESVAPMLSEALTGITERLPMGLVVSDYQFLGEGVGAEYKRFWAPDVAMDAIGDYQRDLALSKPLEEGTLLFSDGTSALNYSANLQMYRTQRGGAVMAGGEHPGGAVVLTGGRAVKDLSYLRDLDPHDLKMHGAVLFGVAFLVRNTRETITDSDVPVSFGDELQMVVLTGITLGKELDLSGDVTKEFVDLLVQLHPRGAGEGYCAADRFRIEGRPLQKTMRNKNTTVSAFRGRDPF